MKVWVRIGDLNETFNSFPKKEVEKMISKEIKLDLMRGKEIIGQINIFPVKKRLKKKEK